MVLTRLVTPLILVLVAAIGESCSTGLKENPKRSSSPRIRKQIEIVSPKSNQRFTFGENVLFELSHRKEIQIDSLLVEFKDQSITVPGNIYTLNSNALRVGTPRIKITSYFEGGKETVYPKIRLYPENAPEEYSYRIIGEFPHDENAFTQGLFFMGDTLVESTGDHSSSRSESISTIRNINYASGQILNQVVLEDPYFGEGCALWNDRIYQLTWTSKTAFVYDKELRQQQTFTYASQGWGLAAYGDTLLLSDGTEKIYFINPQDFSEIDVIQVYDHEGKVDKLNELEVINGRLYANVWGEDKILIIDVNTGQVTGQIDFEGIIDRTEYRGLDFAMNGIAYHSNNRIFVTGKLWPTLFEVSIFPKSKT